MHIPWYLQYVYIYIYIYSESTPIDLGEPCPALNPAAFVLADGSISSTLPPLEGVQWGRRNGMDMMDSESWLKLAKQHSSKIQKLKFSEDSVPFMIHSVHPVLHAATLTSHGG